LDYNGGGLFIIISTAFLLILYVDSESRGIEQRRAKKVFQVDEVLLSINSGVKGKKDRVRGSRDPRYNFVIHSIVIEEALSATRHYSTVKVKKMTLRPT